MTKKIAKITRRKGSLVAKCRFCSTRGGPVHVPWKVELEPVFGSGRSGAIEYLCDRCKKKKY